MLEFISRVTGKTIKDTEVEYLSSHSNSKTNKNILCIQTSCNNISDFQIFLGDLHNNTNNEQIILLNFETLKGRIRRIEKESGKTIAKLRVSFDFLFLRVLPRLFLFQFLMNKLTRKRLIVLSKAEGLGRMVYAGFEIIETCSIGPKLFVLIKKSKSEKKHIKPSYGPIFKMERIGKNGKLFGVYKLRTMHPYAEFLHEYILKINGYSDSGKPDKDFRVTNWGKYIRRYWIDELPQLFNVLKGEMKLVGIRPVSKVYFNELDENIKTKRIKFKPGCIPPYIALNYSTNKDDVIAAEIEYMRMKEEKPYTTDIKLFFKTIFNIIFKKRRSA